VSIIIFNLIEGFVQWGSRAACMIPISEATRLCQASTRQARLPVQFSMGSQPARTSEFADTQLRSYLMGAGVAWGEDVAMG